MAALTKKRLQWYLIVVNFLFFASGTALLVLNCLRYFAFGSAADSQSFSSLQIAGYYQFHYIAAICLNGYMILMALCGLFGACLKNRCLLRLFLFALCLYLLLLVTILILLSLAISRLLPVTLELLRKHFSIIYGNGATKDSVDFTKQIDNFADQNSCCGWSNSDYENLYVKSAWFAQAMRTAAAPEAAQTLPKSCCTSSDEASISSCITTKDLKVARAAKLIHQNTCLEIFIRAGRIELCILIAAHGFLILLTMLSVYATFAVMKMSLQQPLYPDQYLSSEDSSTSDSN